MPHVQPPSKPQRRPKHVRKPDFFVYALTDPRTDETRYIGKSESGMERPIYHRLAHSLAKKSYKNSWIKALKAAGLDYGIEILSRVPSLSVKELNEEERGWIAIGRFEGWPLTNLTLGGGGFTGPQTPEHREAISASLRGVPKPPGRKLSETTKKLIGAALTGRPVSEETRLKLRNSNLGQKCSPETRAKMSAAGKRRVANTTLSASTRAKLSASITASWVIRKEKKHAQ